MIFSTDIEYYDLIFFIELHLCEFSIQIETNDKSNKILLIFCPTIIYGIYNKDDHNSIPPEMQTKQSFTQIYTLKNHLSILMEWI